MYEVAFLDSALGIGMALVGVILASIYHRHTIEYLCTLVLYYLLYGLCLKTHFYKTYFNVVIWNIFWWC